MNVRRPTNWQEECILLDPNLPIPSSAAEIRERLLRAVSEFKDPDFRAMNTAQIQNFSDEDLLANPKTERELQEYLALFRPLRCSKCEAQME